MTYEYSKEIKDKIFKLMIKMMEKANKDRAFGELALNDFGAAFKEFTGTDMPEGATFQFERQGDLIVVKTPEGELSDEELENVAGGKSIPGINPTTPRNPDRPTTPPANLNPDNYAACGYAAPTQWNNLFNNNPTLIG